MEKSYVMLYTDKVNGNIRKFQIIYTNGCPWKYFWTAFGEQDWYNVEIIPRNSIQPVH